MGVESEGHRVVQIDGGLRARGAYKWGPRASGGSI